MRAEIKTIDKRADIVVKTYLREGKNFSEIMESFFKEKGYSRGYIYCRNNNTYRHTILDYVFTIYKIKPLSFSLANVLREDNFRAYLKYYNFSNMDYMGLYNCTYNYSQILKIGEYYFTLSVMRGYKNISSLKKLL